HRHGDTGPGLVGVAALEAQEVRQVGGQHGEPARVDGRDHPERQVVGPGLVGTDGEDHASTPNSSPSVARSSSSGSAPLWTSTTSPSVSMNTVVGMASPPKKVRASPSGSPKVG